MNVILESKSRRTNLKRTIRKPNKKRRKCSERIGWHPSDLKQIEVYSRMSPARKVAQMFWWRGEQMRLLKERLRREHPDLSDMELAWLLQRASIDLVREHPSMGSVRARQDLLKNGKGLVHGGYQTTQIPEAILETSATAHSRLARCQSPNIRAYAMRWR